MAKAGWAWHGIGPKGWCGPILERVASSLAQQHLKVSAIQNRKRIRSSPVQSPFWEKRKAGIRHEHGMEPSFILQQQQQLPPISSHPPTPSVVPPSNPNPKILLSGITDRAMETHFTHSLFERRPFLKSKAPAVKWVKEWYCPFPFLNCSTLHNFKLCVFFSIHSSSFAFSGFGNHGWNSLSSISRWSEGKFYILSFVVFVCVRTVWNWCLLDLYRETQHPIIEEVTKRSYLDWEFFFFLFGIQYFSIN